MNHAPSTQPTPSGWRRRSGVTLVELAIVLAVVAVLTLLTVPSVGQWMRNQRLRDFTRSAADILLLARSEAARTGNRHVVFFGPSGTSDPGGTAITNKSGENVAILALADGTPAASNCHIDVGEERRGIQFADDVQWGVSLATTPAPGDEGSAPFVPPQSGGGTFADPTNNTVPWLLFRPDGVPVVFTGAAGSCGTVGQTGTGGGALYTTNGDRDYAVVLSPIGGVSVFVWNDAAGDWQS